MSGERLLSAATPPVAAGCPPMTLHSSKSSLMSWGRPKERTSGRRSLGLISRAGRCERRSASLHLKELDVGPNFVLLFASMSGNGVATAHRRRWSRTVTPMSADAAKPSTPRASSCLRYSVPSCERPSNAQRGQGVGVGDSMLLPMGRPSRLRVHFHLTFEVRIRINAPIQISRWTSYGMERDRDQDTLV